VIVNFLLGQRLQPSPMLGSPHVLLQCNGRNAVFAASTGYVRATISESGSTACAQAASRLCAQRHGSANLQATQ
jgi:hypothetical protein